jgi:hypothetical protein
MFIPSSELVLNAIFLAAQYDIRYSTKFNDFLDETLWSSLPQITVNDVISGSLSPLPAGDFVNFEVINFINILGQLLHH